MAKYNPNGAYLFNVYRLFDPPPIGMYRPMRDKEIKGSHDSKKQKEERKKEGKKDRHIRAAEQPPCPPPIQRELRPPPHP
jgi:hypothetical protein